MISENLNFIELFRGFVMLEHLFREVAQTVGLLAEAAVVLIVAWGAAEALFRTVRLVVLRHGALGGRREIWLGFAAWIMLALEFALAADIIRTAIAPTWEDIGMLGAIAAIRTGLNWFLARDITHFNSTSEHKA
ncbi:MAG: DUF1622 domain-containing protein [Phenylobacterium sp.]|uniref:DUF1622 domain-containing protein n=1 Tax=Phenylobacterium sp. TaxID=1871053 RepID=UPI0030165157